jgi:glycine cleavage system H protein
MNIPADLKYTESHEWVRTEADGSVTVGITAFAQDALGDIVYVELPAVGADFDGGQQCAVVESVKAASDIYSPIGGKVTAINEDLASTPELINQDAYAAWMFRLAPADASQVAALLDADAYGKNTHA